MWSCFRRRPYNGLSGMKHSKLEIVRTETALAVRIRTNKRETSALVTDQALEPKQTIRGPKRGVHPVRADFDQRARLDARAQRPPTL